MREVPHSSTARTMAALAAAANEKTGSRAWHSQVAARAKSPHLVGLGWNAAPELAKPGVVHLLVCGEKKVSCSPKSFPNETISGLDGHDAAQRVAQETARAAGHAEGADSVGRCTRQALLHFIMSGETRSDARVPTYH